MIRVALTGNIASGKSTVQKIIEQSGYKVLDTDKVGHDLLESLPEVKAEFKEFDIFDSAGLISREKLGKLVFSDSSAKNKLEAIVHPAIKNHILKFLEQNKNEELVFVGIPLLFETGMTDIFDKVVLVYTDDAIRKERLIKRSNYTPEYAEIRMKSQLSQNKKIALSDYVINNSGTLTDLENQTKDILNRLVTR